MSGYCRSVSANSQEKSENSSQVQNKSQRKSFSFGNPLMDLFMRGYIDKTEFGILCIIRRYENSSKGKCWASNRHIADSICESGNHQKSIRNAGKSITIKTVKNALTKLKRLGLIKSERVRMKRFLYITECEILNTRSGPAGKD